MTPPKDRGRSRRPKPRSVVDVVQTALERREVQNQRIVVGVSGGADSVALLRILCELREPARLTIAVAHFDHGLRADSADDSGWVQQLCGELHFECFLGAPMSPGPATHVEAWARKERYDFLTAVARNAEARWVATAHTSDDQAETVLHHIIRGTGLAGLAGMPVVRRLADDVRLIRPCLAISRASLRSYLLNCEQEFREDPTNSDLRFTRNRIRNEVLPFISERMGRNPSSALLKLAEQARGAAGLLRQHARRILRTALLEQDDHQVRLSSKAFTNASRIVVQEAAVQLWKRMDWPRREMTQRHWQRAAELIVGEPVTELQWPGGITGSRRGELVAFERHL